MNLKTPTRAKPTTQPVPVMRDGRELVARMDARFAPETYDAESNTIRVSLGTGAPVQRYNWNSDTWFIEVLDMDERSWRLDRMNSGAPFLADHRSYDLDAIIGKFVPGSVRIENGELVGAVKLSRSKRSEDNVRDILDGIIANTSVGYAVHRWADGGIDEETQLRIYRAVDIEGLEGSAVGIPADITGGIRSAEADVNLEVDMADEVEKTDKAVEAVEPVAASVAEVEPVVAVDERALAEKAIAEYEARCQDIRLTGRKMGLAETEIDAVVADRGLSAESAIRKMADIRAEKDKMSETNSRVDVTHDVADKRRNAIGLALEGRARIDKNPDKEAMREFGNLTLREIVRDYLGGDTRGMSNRELFNRMTSSDFPLILANLANKIALARTEASAEYRWFERVFTRMDYNDFRPHSTPWLGAASSLSQVNEGEIYTLGTMNERNEASTAIKYGRDFDFTMEMMVNDDLDAFALAPSIITEAAWRQASNLCAALLSGNQTMGDGNPLFDVAHANIGSSNGVPTAARLNQLDGLLLDQSRPVPGGGVERIGTAGKFLLFPASLKPTIKQLFEPVARPDYTTEVLAVGIPEENRIVVPSFTGTSYYMATGRVASARYGYLRDEGGLVVTQYAKPEADKVVYHARLTFGAHINKWEDFAYNAGV